MSHSRASGAGTLVATDIRLSEQPSGVRLSCELQGVEDLSSTVWFDFPAAVAPFLEATADAFLPVLLLAAMKRGVRLEIESDVSAALLATVPRIMAILGEWNDTPEPLSVIEVQALAKRRTRRGRSAGVFFSGGVDSSFTLFRNISRYPEDDSRRIKFLLLVWGFDIALTQGPFFERVRHRAEAIARELGAVLVPVRTNLRDLLRELDWGRQAHGAGMASVGLALGNVLHTVFIAASNAFVFLYLQPWGSHAALDPLWSTEQVEFVFDGGEVRRLDKVRFLAGFPLGVRHLRVCFANGEGEYNCGRCSKCVRTMIELQLFDALDHAEEFPHTVDPAVVERLQVGAGYFRRYWVETLREMRRMDAEPALIRAIEVALGRSRWMDSRLGHLEMAAVGVLSRIGVTPARIKTMDQRFLAGAGQALVQGLYRRRRA